MSDTTRKVLIVVYGPPGSGKDALADKLRTMASDPTARRLAGAEVISTNDAESFRRITSMANAVRCDQ